MCSAHCCVATVTVAAAVICVVKHNICHVRNGVASHLICVARETEVFTHFDCNYARLPIVMNKLDKRLCVCEGAKEPSIR